MKYLIIVDMQNDFVSGPLGSQAAKDVAECIALDVIPTLVDENTCILCTMDTHLEEDYLDSMEGKKLPTPHCLLGTVGWNMVDNVRQAIGKSEGILPTVPGFVRHGIVCKPTFGSVDLINALDLLWENNEDFEPTEFILVGVCTDICVISNAMILKASFPEVPIKVLSNYCAGTTKENHLNALKAMEQCHIEVI